MTLTETREARALARQQQAPVTDLERILIQGDLSKLSSAQRVEYVQRLCERTGLDALTQPFEYLTLNNKLVLYAKKACTDGLRAVRRISVVDMDQEEREGIYSVTVKVQDADGRTDMDIGSVKIAGLSGDGRANAIMKASTKAKRRATLSICGLGLLDETEIETIPTARQSAPSIHDAQSPVDGGEESAAVHPQRRVNIQRNPETGKERDLENARNQRPEWAKFTDRVQGFVDARDGDGLKQWFTSAEIAAYVGGWVFKDEANEHYDAAMDRIEVLSRA